LKVSTIGTDSWNRFKNGELQGKKKRQNRIVNGRWKKKKKKKL